MRARGKPMTFSPIRQAGHSQDCADPTESDCIARDLRLANTRLRDPDVIDAGTRELVILITAREHDCQFEWVAHEAEAKREGVYDDVMRLFEPAAPWTN